MKPNSEVTQCVSQPSHYRQIHTQRQLLLTLTAIVFMLICEASAAADQGAFYVNKWGSEGLKDQFDGSSGYLPDWDFSTNQFDGPSGIAMDSFGYIYVADAGKNCIRKFKPNGEFELQWGDYGKDDGQFDNPQGIAVDSEGNVYVADEGNDRIQIFNFSGVFLQQLGGKSHGTGNYEFDKPSGVAVWGNQVYVADTNNHRVQKFHHRDLIFDYLGTLGGLGPGNGIGQFDGPRGIAVDQEGNVYVADTKNHRIQKFGISDAYLGQWGSGYGPGNFEFRSPRGVAVDDNGAVYIVDKNNNRIKKYNSDGVYLGKWGTYGTHDGQFIHPGFVAVGKGCAILVSDTDNDRVQKFACDNSNFLDKWGLPYGQPGNGNGEFNRPQGVAVDSSGYVYVADTGNHRIQKFNSKGDFVGEWGQQGTGDSEFEHPVSVAVNWQGSVYVADRDNKRIQKFDSDGNFLTKWGGPNPQFGDPQLDCPTNVAVDLRLNVYVVDGERVLKFSKNGGFIDSLGPNDGSNIGPLYPGSVLTYHRQYYDTLYVTSTCAGNPSPGIRQFTPPWFYSQPDYFYLGQQSGNFDGLAVDSEHNLYAFNTTTHYIQKFISSFSNSSPSTFVYFHQWGGGASNANAEFDRPSGIAVDKNCNVYVADRENHRIQKFGVVGSPGD